MLKIMNVVLWSLIVVVALFAVLHFSGHKELAEKTGNAIAECLGGANVQHEGSAKGNKDDAYDEVVKRLGWDIREIKHKEVSKLREGLERIEAFIYELEQKTAIEAAVLTSEAQYKDAEAQREMHLLKAQIDEAVKYRDDPNTVYPVTIKGVVITSREELEKVLLPAAARFKALKLSESSIRNAPSTGERQKQKIARQLIMAKEIRQRLKAKLSLAEMTELGYTVEENEDVLRALGAGAQTILEGKGGFTGEVENGSALLDEILDSIK